jgi:hypothetical protein
LEVIQVVDQTVLAEMAAFIEGCSFPCTRQDLIDLAEDQNAVDEVITILERLPDQEYLSETYVVEAAEGVTR